MTILESDAVAASQTPMGGWTRTELGGIPAYVLDTPGPPRGELIFRVGRADESLPTTGLSDLVRRMALGFTDAPLDLTSSVTGSTTSFGFDATSTDLAATFAELGERLSMPDLDRIDDARDAIRDEQNGRDLDEIAAISRARFGPRGQGLAAFEPYGLERAGGEEMRAWHSRYFTAANAVLWIVGEVPTDLDFGLREDGERRPLAEAKGLPHPFPAWVSSNNARVALAVQALESPALEIGLEMLTRRTHEFMRERAALVHGTRIRHDVLDGATSHVSMLLDIVGTRAGEAISTFVTVVNRLADTRPDVREIDEAREIVLARMSDLEWRMAQTTRAANLELLGYAPPTVEYQRSQAAALEAATVHDTFRAALETTIYHLPTGVEMPAESCPKLPRWSRVAVEGHEFEPAVARRDGQKLIVAQAGVTISEGGNHHRTSLVKSCAGLFKWADGGRELMDATGISVRIDPSEWIDGDAAIETIDSLIPMHRHIEKGRRLGVPEVAPDRRRYPTNRLRFQWTVLLATPIIALWGLSTALTASSTPALIASFFAALGAGVAGWAYLRRLLRDTSIGGRSGRPEIYDAASKNYDDPQASLMVRDHEFFPGGTLLAWLVNRNLVSVSFGSTSARDMSQVRSRSMSGPEMYQKWNGLLVSDMLDEEANEFLFDYMRLEPIIRPSVDGKSGYAFNFRIDYQALGGAPPTAGTYSSSHAWNVYDRVSERLDSQFEWWKQNRKMLRVKRVVSAPPRFLP
ncbi:MAG: hypothetical protein OEU32_04950 [Acidimicrobiia bacterium]|nr:hypothetical protein [Acidimicrobiia bacterium]